MTALSSSLPFCSEAWPRWRRILMTGEKNLNYRHGKYTNKRRWRLERPVNAIYAKWLMPHGLYRLMQAIARLDQQHAAAARELLEHITEALSPTHWALADERRGPGHDVRAPRFYIPRRSWVAAAKFLRAMRALHRLIFLSLPSMPSAMSTSYGREKEGRAVTFISLQTQNIEARKQSELARLRDWCARHGLSVMPAT